MPKKTKLEQAAEQWAKVDSDSRGFLIYSAAESMLEAQGQVLAEARDILAEVLADICDPEPGNPWRLHSMRRAAAFLTGDKFGFSSGPVMRARLARGTLGGRFKPPYCGAELEKLGRLAADLAEIERKGDAKATRAARKAHAAELAELKARGILE